MTECMQNAQSRGRSGGPLEMKAQEICNAIYGLQGMDSRYPEVVAVVSRLNKRLAQRQQRRLEEMKSGSSNKSGGGGFAFTAQGVGNALSGLQSMSFKDSEEISTMLGYLADETELCAEVMKAQDLANALFGWFF